MDAVGNQTGNQTLREDGTVNFTVQSSTNRYTSIGGSSISHDDAGNLTVDKDGYKCFYDYENRLVKIQKPDGSGGWDDVSEMAYDALGRRIRMIDSVASTTTLFYYNPDWQCLAEYDDAGALQRYFVYGNYIDEPLVMHRQSDGEDYYYGQDHLYSTVVLIDDGGSVVERCEYDAYGTMHIMDASYNSRSVSSYGNPYSFTGRRLDMLDGGGLLRMHYRHRDYDVYAGRFLQHDPLGVDPGEGGANSFGVHMQHKGGMSLYEYGKSEPMAHLDPLGTIWTYPGMYPIVPPDSTFWHCVRVQQVWPEIPVHCYMYYGASPWGMFPGGVGCGFSEGGVAEEKFFNPTKCRQCTQDKTAGRKLEYGSGKSKACKCASKAEIWSCVTNYPPRKKYNWLTYNCITWAKEAAKNCCLDCKSKYIKAPYQDDPQEWP